jgi:hypothetical protein
LFAKIFVCQNFGCFSSSCSSRNHHFQEVYPMTQPQSHQPQPQRNLHLVPPLPKPRREAAVDLWESLAALEETFEGTEPLTDEDLAQAIAELTPEDSQN